MGICGVSEGHRVVYGPINQASTVGGQFEIRRTTAPTRRASSQRSTALKHSANATILPPTNERRSTTNEKSSHPLPTHLQLNPIQQILKAMIRGITPSHGQARPIVEVSRMTQDYTEACSIFRATGKRYGRKKEDTWRTKGADGTISRVEIIGRTGERAEIRGFSEVST